MESKDESILRIFFNEPAREWHFEEIVKAARIARSKADRWLKRFIKEGLIKRVKERGKMPYYISRHDAPQYRQRKKLFALKILYQTGFLNHLASLPKAKTVIIFGSFARSDWYSNSDIDLFIYGKTEGLKLAPYELKLKREMQVFACRDKNELWKFGEGLLKNIIKGHLVKGDIDFVKVSINA